MATATGTAATRIDEIRTRLRPGDMRAAAFHDLNEMFRAGSAPEGVDGFLPGTLVMTSTTGMLDAAALRLARTWMPWLGKSFDSGRDEGVNVLTRSARGPMKVLWPSYELVAESDRGIEAFPFRTRVAPGEVDPGVQVLKIDYDFPANPQFLIRRVLDELVQVEPGFFLGKILFRTRRGYRPIGFFTLEEGAGR